MSIARVARENREKLDSSESVCVVCFKNVEYYSIGECDHPVCFECSTRMRVLCLQNECPICRKYLRKVVFTPDCRPFKELHSDFYPNDFFDIQYNIAFTNDVVKQSYLKLLEHNCKKCNRIGPFKNFSALRDHMKNEHELLYCDLCASNLKIFTFERKYYTRSQLALHRRKGDPDDSSHKGHPLCEFCETRYMDTDELYRHLRKYHLYCHLCDADGFDHYYGSYNCLRDHFRKEHHLCEEGDCSEQNLTAVFRTDIDLIAHKAIEHGKGLSKHAARQARTLELQFTLTPRPLGPRRGLVINNAPIQEEKRENFRDEMPSTSSNIVAIHSTEQFPSLGVNPPPSPVVVRPTSVFVQKSTGSLAKTEENFPALRNDSNTSNTPTLRVNITHQAGPSNAIIKNNGNVYSATAASKPNVSIQVHNHAPTASRFKLEPAAKNNSKSDDKISTDIKKFEEEFPSLNKKDKNLLLNSYTSTNSLAKRISNNPTTNQTIIQPTISKTFTVSQKAPPSPTSSAFPALCPVTTPIQQPQWIVAAKPKEHHQPPKQSKIAPAPQIPKMTDINSSADFPSLSNNNRNKNKKNKIELNNNKQVEVVKLENNKKEKKKVKNEDISNHTMVEIVKRNTPDTSYKPLKLNDSSKNELNQKIESESTWIDTTSKKTSITPKQNEKTNKTKENIEETSKKMNSLNLTHDFPALNSNKSVPGFRNAKSNMSNQSMENKISYNENTKSRMSYSDNLKRKHNESNNNTKKENDICLQENVSPPTTFQNSIPPCNGFTFTNSSGESYQIPVHNYLEPPNFNQRNKALVINFMTALTSEESIEEFKEFSRQFREGVYSAELYFEHCQNAIGEEFESLFPELLVLLPDIGKQQELHKIYKQSANCHLEVCSSCGQILLPEDVKSHISSHDLQINFPELGMPVHGLTWRK